MSGDLESPLTAEELAAGGGYEPLITDTDCTPRIRRGESLREYRERTTPVVDGMEAPDPHAAEDARWNRYMSAARDEMLRGTVGDVPTVVLLRGEIRIVWPEHVSDRREAVIELIRHAEVLAFQLDEVASELRRRRLER